MEGCIAYTRYYQIKVIGRQLYQRKKKDAKFLIANHKNTIPFMHPSLRISYLDPLMEK